MNDVAVLLSTDRDYSLVPFMLPTKFPPSFGGDRLFYGASLFTTLLIGMTACAALIEVVRLYRGYSATWRTPAQMHRLALGGMLVATIMQSLPRAVFYLTYGDPSVAPTTALLITQLRTAFEIASVLPFMGAMTLLAVSRHALTYQLEREPLPTRLWSTRAEQRKSAAMGLCALILAFGVAFAK